ncbi:MAG: ferredoxin family protein [Verrucomicrobia bacterium]|nr:ferredoxin family protein [Verrucomicrobiota bacterium]
MLKVESQPWTIVWYDGTGSRPMDGDLRFHAFRSLLERGYSVIRAVLGSEAGAAPGAGRTNRMLVLGSFVDGVPRLEDAAGEVEIAVRDITGMDVGGIVETVEGWREGGSMNQPPQAGGTSWKPWFPVIDYSRCTNCMQCLSFCLFDVYGIDDGKKIQVQNQDNCKTNCPACSRVCPEVAIMFPKYSGGPINGAPVSEQDVNREKMKVDISALLGGDIYASLRTRSEAAKSRFSKERSPDKALEERKKCLVKLQDDGFIPAEVLAGLDLASLPTPDEILRKAREKAEQAAAARGDV